MSTDFALEGVLNISRAEAIYADLTVLEAQAEPVKIHAQDVSRIDTAILQILVAFFRSMSARGVDIQWGGVSDEFKAAVSLLGLETELNIPK